MSAGAALQRLAALLRKETRQLLRDKANLAVGLLLPVVLILPAWMFGPGDAAPTNSGQLVLDFGQLGVARQQDPGHVGVEGADPVEQAPAAFVEGERATVDQTPDPEDIDRTSAVERASKMPTKPRAGSSAATAFGWARNFRWALPAAK